jgi:cephalosporin hydroxylase
VPTAEQEEALLTEFHKLYYHAQDTGIGYGAKMLNDTFWLGHQCLKTPMDLFLYQEIIFETRPDWIIETGTYIGGSAYFLASMCQLLGHGQVLTIDMTDRNLPIFPRVTYLTGNSILPAMLECVHRIVDGTRVMVILDSDHRAAHVLNELRLYGPMVALDCYMVVEDTNINGHPVLPEFGPGPHEAVNSFLLENNCFYRDSQREHYMLTMNPGGFLRRVR